jgi:hypothetical protein
MFEDIIHLFLNYNLNTNYENINDYKSTKIEFSVLMVIFKRFFLINSFKSVINFTVYDIIISYALKSIITLLFWIILEKYLYILCLWLIACNNV